jgi:hypothetical protein
MRLTKACPPSEGCEINFCSALNAELERVAYHFGTRCGLLFLAPGAQPDVDRARRYFERLDPLVAKIVTIRDEKVCVEWSRRMPQTSPNIDDTGRRTKK